MPQNQVFTPEDCAESHLSDEKQHPRAPLHRRTSDQKWWRTQCRKEPAIEDDALTVS
ncbi:unnamed protein product [Arabis nemorensis]|uniref:Uncharacterized protein n=1 Tax=Arabis nemorensis TaxID=586526 RepID=A0A565AQC9_9BRAS|nr:unnamed protein product [Arabis nemorensis]